MTDTDYVQIARTPYSYTPRPPAHGWREQCALWRRRWAYRWHLLKMELGMRHCGCWFWQPLVDGCCCDFSKVFVKLYD